MRDSEREYEGTPVDAVRRRVAAWAGVAASADLVTKLGAAWLHGHSLFQGLVVQSVNPAFSLGIARLRFEMMIVLAVLVLVGFGWWCYRLATIGTAPCWAPGLLIGGALANLVDRLLFGAVHDWLFVAGITYNLADFLVVAGLIGMAIPLLRSSNAH